MTSQHDNPKRWWPRFAVRTLVIVVTLVCCYAACWGPTKKLGRRDVSAYVSRNLTVIENALSLSETAWLDHMSVSLPLLIKVEHLNGRHYYFWFFGYVAKLPYEREIDVIPTIPLGSPSGTRSKSFRDPPSTHLPFWIALVCRCVDS